MTTIKIISNPYKKDIRYQRLEEASGNWVDINYEKNPNSKLLSKELVGGFFPFKVKQIVERIIDEYDYRNPSAHRVRLSRNTAADCMSYMLEQIKKLKLILQDMRE